MVLRDGILVTRSIIAIQSVEILRKFKTDCEAYWQFTVGYGYGFIKNCIEWVERCIQKLESINGKSSKED